MPDLFYMAKLSMRVSLLKIKIYENRSKKNNYKRNFKELY